jgi:hypothetical protein
MWDFSQGYKKKMTRLCAAFLSLLAVFGLSLHVHADMGMVRVGNEDVKVSEEAQKAIILHNLDEEILILATDLKASRNIGILRFIPFPSEPEASPAPADVFEKVAGLIKKYGLKYQEIEYSKGNSSSVSTTGVELRFNQRIGAHDLTVIKVNDVSTFRTWMNDFFRGKGFPLKEAYPEEEAIVDDYVVRGFPYFVLDFVEVQEETRSVDPVMYRFKSKELYYPLKTSNTFGGKGTIELFVIAPTTLCSTPFASALYQERPGRPVPCFNLDLRVSTSADVSQDDLREVYPGAAGFFKGGMRVLQAMRYAGDYRFEEDIRVDVSRGFPREEKGVMECGRDLISVAVMEKLKEDPCSLRPGIFPFMCEKSVGDIYSTYYLDPESDSCKALLFCGCDEVRGFLFNTEKDCERRCKKR